MAPNWKTILTVALAFVAQYGAAEEAEPAEPPAFASQTDEEGAAYVSAKPKGKYIFFENFDDQGSFDDAWAITKDEEYSGAWGISAGSKAVQEGDLALEVMHEAKKHGISAKFPGGAHSLGDAPLVLQYEVRLEKPHNCGGLYVKLLRDDDISDLSTLNGDTAYTIMFGPDKCGTTDKIHFILKHKNPKTEEYEEKHASKPPNSKHDTNTHLYTLVLNPDNSYEYLIDQVSAAKGSLLEDMTPAVNPPKQIDDPEDSKPDDWVDEAQIDDPEASKPDDWDEDAPEEIVDATATMPEDWDQDAENIIADPSAELPDDWEVEEDGEWEAPKVPNPACAAKGPLDAGGCGKWAAPVIPNPAYKGKWYAAQIDNPEYKGVWAPRQIDNPNFFEDLTPLKATGAFSAIGVEIWTMSNGIFFDNMLITTDPAQAEAYATSTWAAKHKLEEAKDTAAASGSDPMVWADNTLTAVADSLEALGVPADYSKPAVLTTLLVVLITSLFLCFRGGDNNAADFADLAADVPPPAEGEPAEGEPAEEEPAEEELAEEAELPKKETKGKKKK